MKTLVSVLSLALTVGVSQIVQMPMAYAACGSGFTEPLVPDNPYGWSFEWACAAHDNCYDVCGAVQTFCDNQFYNDLIAICSQQTEPYTLARYDCEMLASTYYNAVSWVGDFAFSSAQQAACQQYGSSYPGSSGGGSYDPAGVSVWGVTYPWTLPPTTGGGGGGGWGCITCYPDNGTVTVVAVCGTDATAIIAKIMDGACD